MRELERRGAFVVVVVVVGMLAVSAACTKSEAATNAQSRELFVNACSRCHGADGTGGLPIWEGGPSPRNFRDHDFQKARTDDEIRQTIRNGKGAGMPPFGATFDDAQLTALVLQVRSFDPK